MFSYSSEGLKERLWPPTNERASELREGGAARMCHVQHARPDARSQFVPPSLPPFAEERERESNKLTKEFNCSLASAAAAQDEVSGRRTIIPNVGVSFVIRQSNIPRAKHCAAAAAAIAALPPLLRQPRLFLSRMRRSRPPRPPRPTCLLPLSLPSPDKRMGMVRLSDAGIVRIASINAVSYEE